MQTNPKIKSLDSLAEELERARTREGTTIVLCHGVFDLLHIGHIRHFEQAKKLGDILVVTLTPDQYVNKGPHRPAFHQNFRAEAVAALDCVDYVAINAWPSAEETISLLRPHVYVKGKEYDDAKKDVTGKIVTEQAAVEKVGGTIAFTDDITFSSSSLINRFMPSVTSDVAEYLDEFRQRYSIDNILDYLDKTRSLKVLLVGEAVIDEYQYCETMGKSGKEPILAGRYLSEEKSMGGVLAAANHVAEFCDSVGVLTYLGGQDSQEEFILDQLNDSVKRHFLYVEDSPTIVKRRFVEMYPFQKLFEVYVMDDDALVNAQRNTLCPKLSELVPDYDAVIVTDYGHGMIGSEAAELLCNRTRFLAINTQANAHNQGFNTVSKYRRADYASLSEREIRMEVRSRRQDLTQIAQEVADKLDCRRILITRGRQGCLVYCREEGVFHVGAFTGQIVDRVGAGDAVLAVTSLLCAQNAPAEIVGFIANIVGAQAVNIVANRSSVEREAVIKHIISLLK